MRELSVIGCNERIRRRLIWREKNKRVMPNVAPEKGAQLCIAGVQPPLGCLLLVS